MSGSVEARQLDGICLLQAVQIERAQVSAWRWEILLVCLRTNPDFKNGRWSSDWLRGKSVVEESQGFAGQQHS
jgi:hypothetical protein